MSSLNVRRVIVAVLSVLAGLVITQLVLLVLGTTWAEFGFEAVFVVVSLGIAALIWLDRFLSAEILPD
jgi:hypothetical protein